MTGRFAMRAVSSTIFLLALGATPSQSEQTRTATTTPAEVQRGQALGVAVTSRGRIFLAPRMIPFGTPVPGSLPSQVFAATTDGAGNVFLATGPDGELVKLARGGDESIVFRADEPLLTAVALLSSGDVLAASAPGGRIYKIRPDGKGDVWCETGERYVWALVVNPDGSVLASTGDRGRLLKIDRNGKAKVFFDADEAHLVSLVPTGDGGVWAGGSARGLVYHIDAEGRAFVAYCDELPEAKAIVVTARGELIVAFDAPLISEKRPPALRLRMAGGSTGAKDAMTDLEARPAPALQGVIEGLPAAESDESLPLRGKIVRVAKDGVSTELWRSRSEAPFAMTLDDDDRPLFATGEPAKLWRVEGPDEIALLATLREGQATAFAGAGRAIVAATSNPAAIYRLEMESPRTGTFTAPPADAGSVARWGTLDWRNSGSGGRVEIATRTGNCEAPDGTWSAWTPPRTEPQGSPVANPDGRFLQWRATLSGTGGETPGVNGVTASYATRNRPPSIRDLRLEPPGGAINAKATIRWSASDPDGDGVTVEVQARPVGATAWKKAVRTDAAPPKPSDPSLGNDGSSKDGKATWDTADWNEGLYDVRAVASDQPSNPPQEGLEAESTLPAVVSIDRTPPSIDAHRKGELIVVAVDDALSGVARLEVVTDGRVAFSPRCVDGVCDGRHEEFRFAAAQLEGDGPWSLKAQDAAGNAVEAPGTCEMTRRLRLACAVALALGAAQACTPTRSRRDNDVRVGISTDPASLSLVGNTDLISSQIASVISDGLVAYDEKLNYVPMIARAWDLAPDGTSVTFHLREGALWHDGERVTSRDVAYTVSKVQDPASQAQSWAPSFTGIASVDTPDDLTVVVHYAHPTADALEPWRVPLIPEHVAAKDAKFLEGEFARHPIGCGPFRFVSHDRGQSVVLEAFDRYWGGRPPIDHLIFKIVTAERTAYEAQLMGELDLNAATADVWHEALTAKAASRLARFVYYRLNTWRVDWNQNDATPYFKDQRVRHALLMALDRERFAATAAGGLARPGVSYYTPESSWSDPSIKALPYDLKESARLLDEAGWALPAGGHVREKNGVPFRFTLLLYSGSQEIADRFAAWMQQSWADIGIDAKVEKLGWETFKQRRRSHDFEAAMGSLSFDATPDAFPLFHSSACLDGFNYGCFSDPEIDRLLVAGRVTVEPTARRAIYIELQKRLDAMQPMGFLFQIAQPMLFDRELEGIVPSPVGLFQFTPGPRAWHWSSAHKRT